LAAGDKSDHRINPSGTPGWGMLQLKTVINLQPIQIQAGIENLLDQSYRLHGSGIDGYGRMGWIRVQVVF
jgi:outer membrane receptor protein involved in Fe transport